MARHAFAFGLMLLVASMAFFVGVSRYAGKRGASREGAAPPSASRGPERSVTAAPSGTPGVPSPPSRLHGGDCSDGESTLRAMREQIVGEPVGALARARACSGRLGSEALEAEAEALAIDALVALGRIGEARGEAARFLERHPTGDLARHVENLTGVHSHRSRPDRRPR